MNVFEQFIIELSKHYCLEGGYLTEGEVFHFQDILVEPETDPDILNKNIWSDLTVYFNVTDDSTWSKKTHPYLATSIYDIGQRVLVGPISHSVTEEVVAEALMYLKIKGSK